MNNLLETFEKKQIEKLTNKKRIPRFRAGDTLRVIVKITEGDKSRLQAFEGMCIARKNRSINSSFTVRKISHGEGVERVFPLFSPALDKIEVVRKGDVRRAKLYYLRDRTGKKARIADRDRGEEADQYSYAEAETSNERISQKESIKDDVSNETKSEESKPVEEAKGPEEKPAEEAKAPEEKPAEEKPAEEAKAPEVKTEDASNKEVKYNG